MSARNINEEMPKIEGMRSEDMVSVWCDKCMGSGRQRHRNDAGLITIKPCQWCRGIGRRMAKRGSGAHRIGSKIIPGLWPNNPYKMYK